MTEWRIIWYNWDKTKKLTSKFQLTGFNWMQILNPYQKSQDFPQLWHNSFDCFHFLLRITMEIYKWRETPWAFGTVQSVGPPPPVVLFLHFTFFTITCSRPGTYKTRLGNWKSLLILNCIHHTFPLPTLHVLLYFLSLPHLHCSLACNSQMKLLWSMICRTYSDYVFQMLLIGSCRGS